MQISPQDPSQVQVYSGYYVARVPEWSNVSFVVQGVKQQSNVNTLGDIAVAGRGDVEGLRAIISLPGQTDFYHSLTLGFDHKHFDQDITIAGTTQPTPGDLLSFQPELHGDMVTEGLRSPPLQGLTFAFVSWGATRRNLTCQPLQGGWEFFLSSRRHLAPARPPERLPGLWQAPGSGGGSAAGEQRAVCWRRAGNRAWLSGSRSAGRRRSRGHRRDCAVPTCCRREARRATSGASTCSPRADITAC